MADDLDTPQSEDVELLDPEALFRSLTGFEEIAIEQHFRKRVKDLADDELLLMRALLFVVRVRDGMATVDAFRTTMLDRLDDVTARFGRDDAAAGVVEDEDPSIAEQRDREYADFVVGVGVSFMPDQFHALTVGQRVALKDAARQAHR